MNYAVILSGGIGTRMRSDGFPKQYLEVDGKPILMYALEPFLTCERIDKIVIVAHEVWEEKIYAWLKDYNVTKPVAVVRNGQTRQDSLTNGLLACAENGEPGPEDKVLVHEAVRPMVSRRIIDDCLDALDKYDSCLPVIPVHDTTYLSSDMQTAEGVIDRDKLACGQAPEGFNLKKYLDMNRQTPPEELATIRGSAELSLRNGRTVGLVMGDPCNFKLTRPGDLELFKAYVMARKLYEENEG